MTDETNTQDMTGTAAVETTRTDGVIAAAPAGSTDPLPESNVPNPIASGEGTAVVPHESLVGARREAVWQEIAKLEAKVTEAYGHMHDEIAEILAKIRAHLTRPSN